MAAAQASGAGKTAQASAASSAPSGAGAGKTAQAGTAPSGGGTPTKAAVAGFQMPGTAIKVQSAERLYWFPYLRGDGKVAKDISDIEDAATKPNPCHGVVLSRHERYDSTEEKPGFYYQIKLRQPCLAVDREKVVQEMKAGDVIIVDERSQLRELETFINTPKIVEAVIMPQGKISGGKGTVGLFDLHAVPTETPRPQLPTGTIKELTPAAGDGAPMGDIPFG